MREAYESPESHEVAPLLLRLTTEEPVAEPPVQTTISDVAEATGLTEEEVRIALREMRRAKLAEELRIMEEPLFRVERPGYTPADTLPSYITRERTLDTLLDAPKQAKKPEILKPTPNDQWVSFLILIPLLAALVYFLVRAVITVLHT